MTQKPNPNLAAVGIYSVPIAAEMLKTQPLNVQRLFALGILDDDRNSDGNVLFRDKFERYVGRGLPKLNMPTVRGNWFAGDEHFASRSAFIKRMKSAADDLKTVTDEDVAVEIKNQLHPPGVLRFAVPPTEKMVEVFNGNAAFFNEDKKDYSFGVSAIAGELRVAAKAIALKLPGRKRLSRASLIESIYESPETYESVTTDAAQLVESTLEITWPEIRTTKDGRARRVERYVLPKKLSSNWRRDVRAAIEIAF